MSPLPTPIRALHFLSLVVVVLAAHGALGAETPDTERPPLDETNVGEIPAPTAEEARQRLTLQTTGIGRVYPLGFDIQTKLTFKQRIGDSQELLWKSRYWNVSAMGGINPANWTAGVAAELEPIAVFQLRAQYEARGFFGTFGALVSGANGDLPITDEALVEADKRKESQAATGHVITVQPTLQAKLGPIAAQNIFAASYNIWDVRDGDTVVYDPGPDMLVPVNGLVLTNTALVAYMNDWATVGVLHQYINPLDVPENDVHRVGALGSFTVYDRGVREGWFHKANITLVSLFHVQHRGRAGLIPTVVAVLSVDSDLLR